ncbi:hypothetical protein CANCADRAFT_30917 [Tortispora caseinolytica NRRL Y-17796]|uniref:NAD(P)H-hydrate epimerase n=1 Tax=Tortispora caseinolytica NRRL Y-17796 TaxID=767744 RepID=A0A1E4TMB5_9ASCO|nr:hypothetical protein CANCADRAFT_30917 [Tortispora caseinolytica NRRL Y-17796]
MELAGLSVACAIRRCYPPSDYKGVLIAAGPGNNGGDGLVCARHLYLFGYSPVIYYPKRSGSDLYHRLVKQLENFDIKFTEEPEKEIADGKVDQIVDALFGFSFKPPIRDPFRFTIELFESSKLPITSVDIPSSWDVNNGPPSEGELGSNFHPSVLVSLTAPKPASEYFKGRHFLGGRFISPKLAKEWGFTVPNYEGSDQIVEYTDSRI